MRRLLFTLVLLLSAQSALAANKNVVLIVADDLGFQLGCYGDRVAQTPHLDRLAAQGTRFTRAHCTTSSCSASRSVMMTGCYNHSTAHYGHEHGYNHFRSYDRVRSLPVMLSEAGYRTCSLGKYHLAPEPVYHFQSYGKPGAKPGSSLHDGPLGLARDAKTFLAANDARPFFLYFCMIEPHRAAQGFGNQKAHPNKVVKYDPAKVVIPSWLSDTPESREEWADYLEAISRMDEGVGALIAALDETGHAQDTLVLFISDNGPPFPGAKTTLYQPGVNLPLIVRAPGQSAPGGTNDARVTWADLAPTILDYAGVAPSPPARVGKPAAKRPDPECPPIAGRSFLGILGQEHPRGWDEVFLSHTFHEITNYYPMRAVISGRYKYIFNVAHPLPFPFASDLYASRTWQGVLERKDTRYGQRSVEAYVQRPRHELYDLEADPGETRNLAGEAAHATTLAELQAKVRAFQKQTRDPWGLKWTYE